MTPDVKRDGRQSDTAMAVQRGTARLLRGQGFAVLTEFTLKNNRRADLIALSPSGQIWIVEIKSSLADFRSDAKWPDYAAYCDAFYFAIPESLATEVMPDHTGLIVADRWGAEMVRPAIVQALHASRRKMLTLDFARTAALRLHSLYDAPELPLP